MSIRDTITTSMNTGWIAPRTSFTFIAIMTWARCEDFVEHKN
jgi:hypothetical protein